mgnify:CR=1 FL=1
MAIELSDLERGIVELLKSGAKRTYELKDQLRSLGFEVRQRDLVKALINLRRRGVVTRIPDEYFDETRPWTTAKWGLAREWGIKVPRRFMVALSGALIKDLGDKLREETFSLFEALEEVFYNAKERLCIAVPYIDPALTGLLCNYRAHLEGVNEVLVLTEFTSKGITTLERLKATLIPQLRYKVLGHYLVVRYGSERVMSKVRGMHLKILVSDSTALIGSFNLTEVHFLSNYDLAILVRGEDAKFFEKLFMAMWRLAREPSVAGYEGKAP